MKISQVTVFIFQQGNGERHSQLGNFDIALVFHGRSSKGDLGLGCTAQSTAEGNARLFQRGRV
ncbi:hypothetical protein [Halomonas llamarensis]|uniref:Uncharacterized protein n=1 Tax=Halomonas llamarensis TaxID=2945104 RepID=A0ABT0SV55_9GAMM|nr:hypothetical protein [Halomonas llamarensis]MCL7931486.1 hypothetical protein [Halomonas llamarensis]MCL7931651.1 hypothetical protein [Halomonas llamarensis]